MGATGATTMEKKPIPVVKAVKKQGMPVMLKASTAATGRCKNRLRRERNSFTT